ncbi:Zinc_finger domain-containing protein [Hexamita inflata]|uniref:Zinc_finger domain-containing protein n=1 Tax=Hexamita inflata TaxID=28002 RepID=A0ABP1HCV5_9EUKA
MDEIKTLNTIFVEEWKKLDFNIKKYIDPKQPKFCYCSNIIKQDNFCFMCDTCSNNILLCNKCLLNALQQHDGHSIRCTNNQIGICNCGDISKFEKSQFCGEHKHSESKTMPVGSPDVLQYFYDYVIYDFDEFQNNLIASTQLQLYLFKYNDQKFNWYFQNMLQQEKNLFRIVSLSFLFSGQNITLQELFILQQDLNLVIQYKFDFNDQSLMAKFVRDELKWDFYYALLGQDFLFKVMLPVLYIQFAQQNVKYTTQLSNALAQSLQVPLVQKHLKKNILFKIILDKIIQYVEIQDINLETLFNCLQFLDSPFTAISLIYHKKSAIFMQLIIKLQYQCSKNALFDPQKQYDNQNEITIPIKNFVQIFEKFVFNWCNFLKYINIKSNLSYQLLDQYKKYDQLEDEFTIQQMSLQQFITQQYNHINNLICQTKIYEENNYFIHARVCAMPVYILQLYIARISQLYQFDPAQLILHILQSNQIQINVSQFISLIFTEWIKTIVYSLVIASGEYFKQNLFDLTAASQLLSQQILVQKVKYDIICSMQVLLPYADNIIEEIYGCIQAYDKEENSPVVQQIFIHVINAILFTPDNKDSKLFLKHLISTMYQNMSYVNLLDSQLSTAFQVRNCELELIFNELFQIQVLDPLKEPKYTLRTLDYIEPALNILNQDYVLNEFTNQEVAKMHRLVNSKQYTSKFSQLVINNSRVLNVLKNLSTLNITTSSQLCCIRIAHIMNIGLYINQPNSQIQLLYNNMFNQHSVQSKLSPKQKYASLKHSSQYQQQMLLPTYLPQLAKESSHVLEQLTDTDNSSQHICDLCHQQIIDIVYYLVSESDSIFDYKFKVLRTCGHKFHQQCCNINLCPVCQKHFNSYEQLYLYSKDSSYMEQDHQYEIIKLKLKWIQRVLFLLQQQPFIDKQLRLKYQNEAKILFQCYISKIKQSQIQQYDDLMNTIQLTDVPLCLKQNLFKISNFDFMKDIINGLKCQQCNKYFDHILKRNTDISLCLICGCYLHLNCQHKHKVQYSILCNTIFTQKYGIIGPYKNKYGGLQKDYIGPQIFLNNTMLSQTLYNLITNEALLFRDQSWIQYITDSHAVKQQLGVIFNLQEYSQSSISSENAENEEDQ